jgi:hypothetical protein
MYLTRNQALVKANRGFESHPLRQIQKHPRKGVFLCLAERVGGRTHWFGLLSGTILHSAQRWPGAESTEGEAQDAPKNPALSAATAPRAAGSRK